MTEAKNPTEDQDHETAASTSAGGQAEQSKAVDKKTSLNHSSLFQQGLVAFLGAAIGAAATLGGNAIGASGAREAAIVQQQASAATSRETEVRTKRAEVYAAYLAAAANYSVKNGPLMSEVRRISKEGAGSVDATIMSEWDNARSHYQNEINQVSVYGSDKAWDAHRKMAAALPSSLNSVEFKDVDQGKFIRVYQGFLSVMCMEVPALPRPGCSTQ